MEKIKTIARPTLKTTACDAGCKECQTSCQSACKTSCTVANQKCENAKRRQFSRRLGVKTAANAVFLI